MQPGAMSPFLVGLAGVLQMRPKNGEADVTLLQARDLGLPIRCLPRGQL